MSGHSKWHSIKHKKGAADAKRGKVFTKHARLITIAARAGADPDLNAALRAAIDYAKADNVPNDNIERAIKKGAGGDADGAQLSEVYYEGFGPEGVAMMIHTITDNRNRSVSNVRTIMTKNGGNLGELGSVAWMFERKGYALVEGSAAKMDEIELQLIEFGADEIERDGDVFEVYTDQMELANFVKALEGVGIKPQESKLTWRPKNTVAINEAEKAKKLFNLIEKLEEDDDVVEVFVNADIPSDIVDKCV